MRKFLIIGLIVAAFLAFLIWLFTASSKPLPGTKIADLGRKHVPAGEKVDYNSNPPTSGPHYGEWIRAGVYNEPKDDRNLVHSLEHGYVVLSYRCNLGVQSEKFKVQSEKATESGESTPSEKVATQDECEQRKNQLSKVFEKKGKRKLIVVPRENLDTNFALTAWNYLDKFNEFDGQRIEKFIDAHRDQGPERTTE